MAAANLSDEEAELCTLAQFCSNDAHFACPRAPAEALRNPQLRRSLEAARTALHLPAHPAPLHRSRSAPSGSPNLPGGPRTDPGTLPAGAQPPWAAPASPPQPGGAACSRISAGAYRVLLAS